MTPRQEMNPLSCALDPRARPALSLRAITAQWLVTACCAAVFLLAAAHAGPAKAEPISDVATVKIDNFTFEPKVLTVKAGSPVMWVNADDTPHTILDKNRKVFRSKVLDTNDKFTFTFDQPGTYDYFCGLHPHMTAQIVVTP